MLGTRHHRGLRRTFWHWQFRPLFAPQVIVPKRGLVRPSKRANPAKTRTRDEGLGGGFSAPDIERRRAGVFTPPRDSTPRGDIRTHEIGSKQVLEEKVLRMHFSAVPTLWRIGFHWQRDLRLRRRHGVRTGN